MSSLYWKVCGITNEADARAAVAAGANALGFVFWPHSPRVIDLDTAAEVARQVPDYVHKVGVFVDASVEELDAAAARVPLDLVQLSGNESPEACATTPRPSWKALRLSTETSAEEAAERASAYADYTLLLDASVPGEYGGTGEKTNWPVAAALAESHRVVLAGGLSVDNLAAAVESVRPWGIDVSSGVEESPGRKDHDKLRRCALALEPYR